MLKKIFDFITSSLNYCFYSLKYRNTDFFHYRELINPNFKLPMGFSSVMLYGNWKAIASLKKSRFKFLSEYLEHGMCFYNSIESAEYLGYINRKGIKTIYTYGPHRKAVLDSYLKANNLTDRTVVSIGPYIVGAKHFYSESQLQALKAKYGKILLVFPSHSFDDVRASYEVDNFIQAIEHVKNQFDTVFICLYWKDILTKPNEPQLYEDKGYVVVTSGHRSDAQFLSRQKDIVSLSNMVMTNDNGSHVGYAISMNKPVYFFSQEIEITKQHLDEFDDGKIVARQKCKELFSTFSFDITEEQKSFIEEYWGSWNKN